LILFLIRLKILICKKKKKVYEVQRRLNELKKGGIDNKRPTSATRAGYISK
jgi:hypothetical protein